MTVELLFRWVSGIATGAAAILVTLSAVYWAHSVVKPAMRFVAVVLWITAVYRLGLAATAFPNGTEWGRFIRLWVNIEFILLAVGFGLLAHATWVWYKSGFTIGNGG